MSSPTITITIKPYSGASYDILSRFFLLVGALIFGGCLVIQTSGLTSRLVTSLFIAVLIGALVVIYVCNYIELDEQHIANVFCIGPLFRFELSFVRWDQIKHAEVQTSVKPRSATLILTKLDGKKVAFAVSRYSGCLESFNAIAQHFHGQTV